MSRPADPADTAAPSVKPYIIAVAAVALWAALRLLPGDITPEAPETALRQTVRRPAPPGRAPQEPRPFPSYDPQVAWSPLDHLPEAEATFREPQDPQDLRRLIGSLRSQLSSHWLSAGGDWRVGGEGVLTCFSPPAESGLLAAALRRPPRDALKELSVEIRFLTPPGPEERAGVTPGLDAAGSGTAFLVGFTGPHTFVAEWVVVKDHRIGEVVDREELLVPAGLRAGPWLGVYLSRTEQGVWQADVAPLCLRSDVRFRSPRAEFSLPADARPGVLLRAQGTRVTFFGFRLYTNSGIETPGPEEAALERRFAEAAESLRLADLVASPADVNFSHQPPERRQPVAVRWVTVGEVSRPAVLAPAPSELRFRLPQVRGQARFEAWVAIHPQAWSREGGFSRPHLLAEEFRIEVVQTGEEGERRLWSRNLKATRDRAWLRVEVPLVEVPAGATLVLRGERLEPGDPSSAVRGGYLLWGNPVVRFPGSGARPSNVVLVVVDSLRADAGQAAPEALGAEGVVFENAFTPAPWCVPALASLHSSLWPQVHGANPLDYQVPGSLSPAAVTLAEVLRRAGYRTCWMSDQPPPQRVNLEQGFEEVIVPRPSAGEDYPLFGRADQWVRSEAREPFFLYLHTYRLAGTVSEVLAGPPQDLDLLREELKRRYQEAATAVSEACDGFFGGLAEGGLAERTLLVLTSDHGTDLCDRYPTIVPGGPGFTLRDEQLHVPLIIRPPKRFGWSRRVSPQVRLIDLAPTLCDLLSIPVSEEWQGTSLGPAIRQQEDLAELPVFASACNLAPDRAAVRHHQHKYIRVLRPTEPRGRLFLEPLPSEQLYNVRQDPGETEDLAEREQERLAEMQRMLLEHLEESQAERARRFPELPGPPEEASGGPSPGKQAGEPTPVREGTP